MRVDGMKSPKRNSLRLSRMQVHALFKKVEKIMRHPALDFLCVPAIDSSGHLIVVTSRSVGNAPTRNRIRRRLKALFSKMQKEPSFDWIVIARQPAAEMSFSEMKELVEKAHESAVKHFCPELPAAEQ